MRLVFDIEADGLLDTATRMWIMCLIDVDTREEYEFLPGDHRWMEFIDDNATELIGHFIEGFDLPLLYKLFLWKPKPGVKIIDTLVRSQVLDYKRFPSGRHSLEEWGVHFGTPKVEHEDWSQYSEEMRVRCRGDTRINLKAHFQLEKELEKIRVKKPVIDFYLAAEQATLKWCTYAEMGGWPFNVQAASQLKVELETELNRAYMILSDRLGTKTVAVDKCKGFVTVKKPKWLKNGCYDQHTSKWFGIDPWSGFEGEERPIEGEYCRIEFKPLSLDSSADVKLFLYRNGWVPTEWNFKEVPGTREKKRTTPKITEDSLEFLGGDGKLYTEFLTAKSRLGILKTWLLNVDQNGRVHGSCATIGTPSMRARHSVIVNVPGADAAWGRQMRELFMCPPGWVIVGCDSSGNQARGLAHYLKNQDFIHTLLHGDIHQFNADVLTKVMRQIIAGDPTLGLPSDFTVVRSQAKRILYAFLFGASGGKLWSYILGSIDPTRGNLLKNGFIRAVPGFKVLVDKLKTFFKSSKEISSKGGFLPGIAGNRIYVDSEHKLLVYLLQACEKATCAAAIMLTAEGLEKAGIPYQPLIFMHDEEEFMVPEEFKDQAAAIGKSAFKEGPKLFGIQIMDGEAKIGKTWYDVH